MPTPANFPRTPAPYTYDKILIIDSDKLANWKKREVRHGAVLAEQAILLDDQYRPLERAALAHTATYALWINVSTRHGASSSLSYAIRRGAEQPTGEVKLNGGPSAAVIAAILREVAAINWPTELPPDSSP